MINKNNGIRLCFVFFIAVWGLFLTACNSSTQNSEPSGYAEPAPLFSLKDLDGNLKELSDYSGKPMIINFFHPECDYSDYEYPDYVKIQEKYSSSNLQIIGICVQPNKVFTSQDIRTYFENLSINLNFPILLEEDIYNTAFWAYFGNGERADFPQTFVLDKNHNMKQLDVTIMREKISEGTFQAYLETFVEEVTD